VNVCCLSGSSCPSPPVKVPSPHLLFQSRVRPQPETHLLMCTEPGSSDPLTSLSCLSVVSLKGRHQISSLLMCSLRILQVIITSYFSEGGVKKLTPRAHVAMAGDTFSCHPGKGAGALLNTVWCPGRPHGQESPSSKVGMPWHENPALKGPFR
jgi:hypothetical protein